MNKVNLTKYGFERAPEEDFSDDGTRFTCYRLAGHGRVRVSKATGCGMYFIAGRVDSRFLDYNDYSKLPSYKEMDRLNGISMDKITEEDLARFSSACESYEKEIIEAESKVVFPTINELKDQCIKIRKHYQEQLDEVEHLIRQVNPMTLLKMNEYTRRDLARYLETIQNRAKGYDPETYPASIQNSAYGRNFVKSTNSDLTDVWYVNQCREIIGKLVG